MITDPQGRVVLDGKYAAAARAAGIPQEGIGGLPSDNVRNKFIQGLASENLISKELSDIIQSSKYNQTAGVGSTESITVTTSQGNISVLKKMMEGMTDTIALPGDRNLADTYKNKREDVTDSKTGVTLYELMTGDYSLAKLSNDGEHYPEDQIRNINNYLTSSFIPQMADQFAMLLDTGDPFTKEALAYAERETAAMFNPDIKFTESGTGIKRVKKEGSDYMMNNVKDNNGNYAGVVYNSFWKGGLIGKKYNSACAVNLSNIGDIFLTHFAKYMEGVAKDNNYNVGKGPMNGGNQKIVTDDPTYLYTFNTGSTISADDMKIANFYDTLFNQLCSKGWMENGNITDNEYLQGMLQNGMMYITSLKDDGYYYQGNYATDSYIKEVSDDKAIAQAEAKYNTEKSKLNQKEQTLDLKMKNMDTEISSLSTEYDTVKSTISKNIERSFKRYSA